MEKEYEVLRLIKQNTGCHIVMDCVSGRVLAEYITSVSSVGKEDLFSYIRQIIKQLGYLQDVKGMKSYRYITPFSFVLKRGGEVMLLDLNAESNRHILNKIGSEKIWGSFFKREDSYNTVYSLGKTIQFLLAKSEVSPDLTRCEEYKLKKIISRCLSDNSKKQYQKFSDILQDFPKKKRKQNKNKVISLRKAMIFLIVVIAVIMLCIAFWPTIKTEEYQISVEDSFHEEEIDFIEIGMTYFLELQDYQKSKEMFSYAKDRLGEEYEKLADYMLGTDLKTEAEIETALQIIETEADYRSDMRVARIILKVCKNLNTTFAIDQGIRIAVEVLEHMGENEENYEEKMEIEFRNNLAVLYEENGENGLALEEYKKLNQWDKSETIYCSMVRLAKNSNLNEAAEICRQGIVENSTSRELRIQYIWIQCHNEEVTKEVCEEEIRRVIGELPELSEDPEFQNLKTECGIIMEGDSIWLEE